MTDAIDLILVRHGNTFGPGDPVVWVGKGEDVPLVESGRAQAALFGETLRAANWSPTGAVCGGLVRQLQHLELATGGTPPPQRTSDLNEVDYGLWGGLSTEAIVESFGPAEVEGWNVRSEIPSGADWPESGPDIEARVASFAATVARGDFGPRVLACSSNGLLRWFLKLVPGAFDGAIERGEFKVKTGHYGRLSHGPSGWSISTWNQHPGTPLTGSD